MRTENSSTSIQDDRNGIFDALRSLDPRLCFTIGLFVCATVSFYIPSIMIALTGVWVNNLTMLIPLLIAVTILVVQNLVGNVLNRVLVVGVTLAVVFDCGEAYFTVRTANHPTWHNWWMILFLPTVACVLNAWLFLKFKVATGLSE